MKCKLDFLCKKKQQNLIFELKNCTVYNNLSVNVKYIP